MSDPQMSTRRRTSLRLTRRGRVAVVLFLVLFLLALTAVIAQVPSGAADKPGAPESYEIVVVQPGDTLWSIARQRAPGGDIRAVIHEIEQLNGLGSGRVQAGWRILIPAALG